MFEAILKDFAWASMLLLIGLFLRSRVKVFQKLFIPVAVIAGLVGLVLGSEILGKFCPVYIHWSDNVSSFAKSQAFTIRWATGITMRRPPSARPMLRSVCSSVLSQVSSS